LAAPALDRFALTYVSQMEFIASMGGSRMASLITSASTKQHLDEREQTKKGRPWLREGRGIQTIPDRPGARRAC